ncbi:DUF3800 domain-containing protein [Mycoplasma phocimorsus]|uniref:DUF3800 domain-containing protein n=1 Tax=Mycoplasma phocimorsus TaxID=3045839 RepID=UPI0024BF5ABA|nr:DUF3800 domain-containing protein [Mycoplasma phocimorsus]MDJ1648397.1 DUF3800 domain-containing protein [Mycoplasma phocimorsus]
MNLFIYADESGVFDFKNNNYFVFAGLIFESKNERDRYINIYRLAEKEIRKSGEYKVNMELKANKIKYKYRYLIFRKLKNIKKFATIIKLTDLNVNLFKNKKTKQRYMDWAFKMGIKNCLKTSFNEHLNEIQNINFYIDQHTTATNGRYELQESLETEFKIGNYSADGNHFIFPITQNLKSLTLKFLDSKHHVLIRASDIVANYVFNMLRKGKYLKITQNSKMSVYIHPN